MKFDTLNEKTIHQRCIERVLTEVYKFLNGYSPDIMNDILDPRQNTYNLRNFHAFATDVPRNNCMLNSVVYRANQLWETLPFYLKMLTRIIQKRIKKLLSNYVKFAEGLISISNIISNMKSHFSMNVLL